MNGAMRFPDFFFFGNKLRRWILCALPSTVDSLRVRMQEPTALEPIQAQRFLADLRCAGPVRTVMLPPFKIRLKLFRKNVIQKSLGFYFLLF